MNTKAIFKRQVNSRNRGNPLRLTALLYLREALLSEKYEDCEEIIRYANEFGATASDVNALLEDARRYPR